jgi:ubiquinone/menaquinone biosynthesis C-methylase UbiE
MQGLYALLLKKLDKIIKDKSIKSICDYGCGSGELLFELKKLNPDLERVTGIDYFNKFQSRPRPDTKEENKDLEFIDKDADDFKSLNSFNFDLVFSTFSLHHWEFPVTELKSINSMLSDKGIIVTIDFAFDNRNDGETVKNLSCFIDQIFHARENNYHRHHYTLNQALDLFKSIDAHIIQARVFDYKETKKEKEKELSQSIERNNKKMEDLKNNPENYSGIYYEIFSNLYGLEKKMLLKYGLDYSRLFIIEAGFPALIQNQTQTRF